jgi:hypothetical protein
MKRLSPDTGKPFQLRDVREDGYLFVGMIFLAFMNLVEATTVDEAITIVFGFFIVISFLIYVFFFKKD